MIIQDQKSKINEIKTARTEIEQMMPICCFWLWIDMRNKHIVYFLSPMRKTRLHSVQYKSFCLYFISFLFFYRNSYFSIRFSTGMEKTKFISFKNGSDLAFPNLKYSSLINMGKYPNKSSLYVIGQWEELFSFRDYLVNNDLSTLLIVHSDLWINLNGVVFQNDQFFTSLPTIQLNKITKRTAIHFSPRFDSVIGFYHYGTRIYGHFFIDVLAPLTLLSKEIVKNSHYLFFHNASYIHECLSIFNVSSDKIHVFKETQFVFCHTVYMFSPWIHSFHGYIPYQKLREMFWNHFGLVKDDPKIILMFNRKRGRRHIINFDSIVESLKTKYPHQSFQMLPEYNSVAQTAHLINQAKVFFIGFHGSGFVNIIFMQEGAHFLEIATKQKPSISMAMSQAININHIIAMMAFIDHFEYKEYIINEKIVFEMFASAMCNEYDNSLIK